MTTIYKTAIFCLTVIASNVLDAGAFTPNSHNPQENVEQMMRKMAPNRNTFSSPRYEHINSVNKSLFSSKKFSATTQTNSSAETCNPSFSIGPVRSFYDIDGPNGEIWYCTTELESKSINYEFYTDYILQEYTFDIYDSQFNLVGTIHDKMRYEEGEVKVPGPDNGINLLPIITKNYFNSDEKFEVVVSIAVNTATPGLNNYRSVVYSINGPKENVTVERNGVATTIEVDKPVMTIPAFISDVVDASTSASENLYMTFLSEYGERYDIDFDKLIEGDPKEGQKYWEILSTQGYTYSIYGKVDSQGNLNKVFENTVTFQTMQGDQESTPPMLTFAHNGTAYALCPRYKDTFYNPYYSPFEDMTMRENNALLIDLYKISNSGSELVSSTEIALTKQDGDDILATYYSVGDFRYSQDVMIGNNGKPTYIVKTCNYVASQDGTTGNCYYHFDANGNKTLTIFENAESTLALTSIPGKPEEQLFVRADDMLGYVYNFVNLSTGYNENTVKIGCMLDAGLENLDILSFNADRVNVGDAVKYAFEISAPFIDDNGDCFMRVAWFNADGSFDRIDYINIGSSVQYAQAYIDGTVLKPNMIVKDDAYEYMILVKRALEEGESASQEELIIAQPSAKDLTGGREVLHLAPCDKGNLRSIGIYPGESEDASRLFIGYLGDAYTADFYNLPLSTSSISDITTDGDSTEILFDGKTIFAANQSIEVYNMQGIQVAKGFGALDITNLTTGIYLAKAGEKARKFQIR